MKILFALLLLIGSAQAQLLVMGKKQGAPIGFIENVTSNGATAATFAATLTSSTVHDHLVCATFYDSADTITTILDSGSNALTSVLAATSFFSANYFVRVDEIKDMAAGITGVTVSFSTSNNKGAIMCNHSSGLLTVNPMDNATPPAPCFQTTPATGNPSWSSCTSGTLSQANELAFGFAMDALNSGMTFTATGSWSHGTTQSNSSDGITMFIETQIVSSTTALQATGTIGTPANEVFSGIATFKGN